MRLLGTQVGLEAEYNNFLASLQETIAERVSAIENQHLRRLRDGLIEAQKTILEFPRMIDLYEQQLLTLRAATLPTFEEFTASCFKTAPPERDS